MCSAANAQTSQLGVTPASSKERQRCVNAPKRIRAIMLAGVMRHSVTRVMPFYAGAVARRIHALEGKSSLSTLDPCHHHHGSHLAGMPYLVVT